jgi:hypothetical protein
MSAANLTNVRIDSEVLTIAQQLEPDVDVGAALRQILINEIRRRLAAYELMVRNFQYKYNMTLAEFEAKNVVAERGYAFEVENDHQDWDQAVDALQDLRVSLQELIDTSTPIQQRPTVTV